jgi:hypothetical protein
MQYTGLFSIFVGVLMIGQWIFSLASRKVPEIATETRAIGFHLAAEFLTAAVLIIAGIALLAQSLLGYPLALLAQGMLVYTLINSAGYFAQRGQWLMVLMFAGILILAFASIYQLFNSLGSLIRIGTLGVDYFYADPSDLL